MVVATYDMRDLHVGVVDDHHVVVNRNAGRPNDDRIAYDFVRELDGATNDVVETNRALGNLEANGAGLIGCLALARGLQIDVAARAGIDRLTMLFHRLFALELQLFLRAEAVVSFAFADEAFGGLAIFLG